VNPVRLLAFASRRPGVPLFHTFHTHHTFHFSHSRLHSAGPPGLRPPAAIPQSIDALPAIDAPIGAPIDARRIPQKPRESSIESIDARKTREMLQTVNQTTRHEAPVRPSRPLRLRGDPSVRAHPDPLASDNLFRERTNNPCLVTAVDRAS
jgi:hypothetical protein